MMTATICSIVSDGQSQADLKIEELLSVHALLDFSSLLYYRKSSTATCAAETKCDYLQSSGN